MSQSCKSWIMIIILHSLAQLSFGLGIAAAQTLIVVSRWGVCRLAIAIITFQLPSSRGMMNIIRLGFKPFLNVDYNWKVLISLGSLTHQIHPIAVTLRIIKVFKSWLHTTDGQKITATIFGWVTRRGEPTPGFP